MDTNYKKTISVVVCTYNRLEMLKKCIDSLLNQTLRNAQIIVVNDASTDGTKEYLNSVNFGNFDIIHHDTNQGLSNSRNAGINLSKSEIIAFTDDDCVVDEKWLEEILKVLVCSNVDFGSGQTFLVSKNYIGAFPERIVTNVGAVWPKGNNLFFRKKVFDTVGLFDPAMDYYSNDDSEIGIRAIAAGFNFTSAPSAVVYHQKTYWNTGSLLRSARNPAAWVYLKKKYPKNYLHFNPPIKYGMIINAEDYVHIILMPILLPVLFVRYIFKGQRDFKLFFSKWPVYPFLRRFYIYATVLREKKIMF